MHTFVLVRRPAPFYINTGRPKVSIYNGVVDVSFDVYYTQESRSA